MARDTSNLVTIPGELHSAATGNIVASTEEIFDYTSNKYQNDINQELRSAINTQLGYYICSTSGDTAAKVIDASGYTLLNGGGLRVNFTEKNTAANATLNIGQTGAKPLYYNGSRVSTGNSWYDGEIVTLFYDGAAFQCNSLPDLDEYDVSARNGGQAFTFNEAVALVPGAYRHGGLKLRFISNTSNKYVEYFLNTDVWSINESDWAGDLSNLQKEIYQKVFSGKEIYKNFGYINSGGSISDSGGDTYANTDFLKIYDEDILINDVHGNSGMAVIWFYDANKQPISGTMMGSAGTYIFEKSNFPANAVYFRSSCKISLMTDKTYIYYFNLSEELNNIHNYILNQPIGGINPIYKGKDIFSIDGAYINFNGTQASNSSYKCTPFLHVNKNQDIVVSGVGGQSGGYLVNFYDENKNFITDFDYSSYIASAARTVIVTKENIPENAVYFRSSSRKLVESENAYIILTNLIDVNEYTYSVKQDVDDLTENVDDLTENVEQLKNSIGEVIGNTNQIDSSSFINNGYIRNNGYQVGTYSDTKYTDFIPVSYGQQISALLGVNAQMGAVILYTTNEMSEVAVSRVFKGGQLQELTQVQFNATVLANEHYVRFCSSYSRIGAITIKTPGIIDDLDSLFNLGDLYDYSKVKVMPKQMLRTMVESASNGKYTVIYDNYGLPSLMCKIPIISLGALNSNLGDLNTPHPAFMVNGGSTSCIYMAPFQSTVSDLTDNVPVCWWGLSPTNGGKSFEQIRIASAQKGRGWHLETIFERSLAILLSIKKNGEKARGNRCYGRENVSGYEYEAVERLDGELPGTNVFAAKWINGTQPLSWSHNGELFGIFDLIGGYWEWTDLIKVVNGQIYLAVDNYYDGPETEWEATGVYIDIDTDGTLSFNTSFNADAPADIHKTKWTNILCKSGYDSISLDLRKKLQQLLICPRLSSTDNSPLFNFDGNFWMKKDQTNYLIHGGAEEYPGCGFGEFAISYPKTESHGNMGSRLCYIEQ